MTTQKPVRGSGPAPDHILLSINGDPAHTMAITWRTWEETEAGYVLYRAKGDDAWLRAEAETRPFISDIDRSRMWWAHPAELTPETDYEYTCGDDAHRAGPFSFRTAPEHATKCKFILVSDQQQGEPHEKPDYTVFHDFLTGLLAQHPDTAFILTGGDNTDCGQHEVQWNGLFSGLAGIAESVPFMMTVGNHDNRGFRNYDTHEGGYYAEPCEFFNGQFRGAYPFNGPQGWETENYTFDYGNVHVAVLGVNEPVLVNDWLRKDLERCSSTWKLGTYHFPICYAGSDCQNYDAYPMMRPSMEKLDVLFGGHEHGFARSFPMRDESLYDRPSEGTVFYTLGNSGENPPGTYALPKVWHCAFYPHEEKKSMACVAEVDGDRLTLTSVLSDGRIVDRCVIDKGRDAITPTALPPIYGPGRTRMLFKGADPGLCAAGKACFCQNGVWYAPLGVLVGYIGGSVEKFPGGMTLEVYGKSATFREGRTTAQTSDGDLFLPGPVKRGAQGQLFVPCDGCHAFGMRWAYAARNNFISFEHMSEAKPVTPQP